MSTETATQVSLGGIASYVVGALALLIGLLYVTGPVLSGLLFLAAGALVFPPIRRRYQNALGVRLSRGVLAVAFLALWLLGAAILP